MHRRQILVIAVAAGVALAGAAVLTFGPPDNAEPTETPPKTTTQTPTTTPTTTTPPQPTTTMDPPPSTTPPTTTTEQPALLVTSVTAPNETADGTFEVVVTVQNTGANGAWTGDVRTNRRVSPGLYNTTKQLSIQVDANSVNSGSVVFEPHATGEWPVYVNGERVGVVDVVGLSPDDGGHVSSAGTSTTTTEPDPSANVSVGSGAGAT